MMIYWRGGATKTSDNEARRMATESHSYEQYVYECDCGAWWIGDTRPTGVGPRPSDRQQNCPRCDERVTPVVVPVD
jgi:hypothetical protein